MESMRLKLLSFYIIWPLDDDNSLLVGIWYPNIAWCSLLRRLQERNILMLSPSERGTEWFVKWFWIYGLDTNGFWLYLLVIFQCVPPSSCILLDAFNSMQFYFYLYTLQKSISFFFFISQDLNTTLASLGVSNTLEFLKLKLSNTSQTTFILCVLINLYNIQPPKGLSSSS